MGNASFMDTVLSTPDPPGNEGVRPFTTTIRKELYDEFSLLCRIRGWKIKSTVSKLMLALVEAAKEEGNVKGGRSK